VEGWTLRGGADLGMATRYLVELDAGGELQVVRQNLETSSREAQELRGRRVRVAWHDEQTFAIDEVTSREEGQA
jgi:putative spermidine/putrescine transport system ATP-binding protein